MNDELRARKCICF